MSRHTGGEWELDDPAENHPQHAAGGNRIFKVVGPRPYGGLIADVSAWWYDTETARENARLIARAPRMDAAIREAAYRLERNGADSIHGVITLLKGALE